MTFEQWLKARDLDPETLAEEERARLQEEWKVEMAFRHSSTAADREPGWGGVDKTHLPRAAFANQGEAGKKSTWGYPHHWVQGGGAPDEDGIYTTGTMYLHRGGLNAAWSAAQGGRSGQEASAAVKAHLQTHRRALGLDKKEARAPEGAERLSGDQDEGRGFFADWNAGRIYLYDVIGDVITPTDVVKALKRINTPRLDVHINSPGGQIYAGTAIYNILKREAREVTVHVDGIAASMASVIAMAGRRIVMAEGTFLMLHASGGLAFGKAQHFERVVAVLRKLDAQMAGIYAARSGRPRAEVGRWMEDETWFDGPEAVEAGLADEVEQSAEAPAPKALAAAFDLSMYRRVPEALGGVQHANDLPETGLRRVAALLGKEWNREDEPMDPKFKEWLVAKGHDPEAIEKDEGRLEELKAQWEAEAADLAKKNQPDFVVAVNADLKKFRAEVAAETRRVAKIRELCGGKHPEIEAKAIEEGWSGEKTELEVMKGDVEKVRKERPEFPGVHTGDTDLTGEVMEAGLCLAMGLKEPEKHFKPEALERAHKQWRRGLGLQEFLVQAAMLGGYAGRPYLRDEDSIREVLMAAFSPRMAGDFSTISIPGILSAAANKFVLAAYDAVESTWREVAAIRPVKDFKAITGYRLTASLEYEKVGASGELKHGTLSEETRTNKADTYGKMLTLTRQHIIDDDLGVLLDMLRPLGRGGALKLNTVLWTAFLNNAAFFTEARGNYAKGAETALGLDSLGAAELRFLDMVGPDGHPLGITPEILLVPNALNVTASKLYKDTEVRNLTGKDTTGNPHAGKFRPVRSSYLSNAKIHGHSAKAWYMLANPASAPVVEAVFLNGIEVPTVQQAEANFNVLGIQMRGYHDFGVALADYRAGVKMKGEA